jgi:colicin import membrane protein
MTTTAPPPEAEALATAPKAIVVSQFDVLLSDIKEAKEKAAEAVFDYSTKVGNKEARSYVFAQRKLKSRIESARTDAKSYALAYGRKVDEQAAVLKSEVEALIKPHEDALDAITKAEANRVQKHRNVIHWIVDLGRVPFGASAETLATSLKSAKAADIDGLEEFKEEAAAALLETIRTLEAAHAKAVSDEAAAAELAQLREQQRIQQEKDAEDARIKAQQEAIAEAARKAQEEADAAALLAIQEAEQKVADADARAAAAEARAADSKAVVALLEGEALLAITPAEAPQPPATMPTPLAQSGLAGSIYEAKSRMRRSLSVAIAGLDRREVVDALIAGTLHPAITIDWSKV